MAPSKSRQFLFVREILGSEPLSQREKELEDASRRSHAARNSKIRQALPSRPAFSAVPHAYGQHPGYVLSDGRWHPSPSVQRSTVQRQVRHRVHASRRTDEINSAATKGAPVQSLVAILPRYGNHDPFDAAPVKGVPAMVFDILEYGKPPR
jgi:hypothetical protein